MLVQARCSWQLPAPGTRIGSIPAGQPLQATGVELAGGEAADWRPGR